MTNIEQDVVSIESPADRDYYTKRDELIAHAMGYVETMQVWAREFHADMAELGYNLEYTESLMLIQYAWGLPAQMKTAEEAADELARYEEQERQFAAEQAINGQEERI